MCVCVCVVILYVVGSISRDSISQLLFVVVGVLPNERQGLGLGLGLGFDAEVTGGVKVQQLRLNVEAIFLLEYSILSHY